MLQFNIHNLIVRPSTLEALQAIEGVTEVWLKQHGHLFLKRIAEFCSDKSDLLMDVPAVAEEIPEEIVVGMLNNVKYDCMHIG